MTALCLLQVNLILNWLCTCGSVLGTQSVWNVAHDCDISTPTFLWFSSVLDLRHCFCVFFYFSSCWLSLEGGLLYAFVGPAAVIVLVSLPNTQYVFSHNHISWLHKHLLAKLASKRAALKQLHVTSEDFPLHSSTRMWAHSPGVSILKW